MSAQAIRIHAHGGPEVMKWEQVPTPQPGPDEVLLRHEAVGLNFIDIYFRSGQYKTPLPATIGLEGAGVVRVVGEAVTAFAPGDRVAYAGGPLGAYATERVIAAERLVRLPETIDFTTAAAMMLQGMTAQYLLRRTFPVQAAQTILVHSAAGGVGLILCQWAKHLGVTVIGVVSTPEKAELAAAHGATHTIVGLEHLVAKVKKLTGGAMVPVVYDAVGRDSFDASLDCLAPRGLMVSYGASSGPVPPVDLAALSAKGSLFVTRPSLASYTATPADLRATAAELFHVVETGAVKIHVNQTYRLAEAALAHTALQARQTTGSTVLLP